MNPKKLLPLALIPFTGLSAQNGITSDTRPNIILFMVDDMGWQDTSLPFWKEKTPLNRRYCTPNMERLGITGDDVYASIGKRGKFSFPSQPDDRNERGLSPCNQLDPSEE